MTKECNHLFRMIENATAWAMGRESSAMVQCEKCLKLFEILKDGSFSGIDFVEAE